MRPKRCSTSFSVVLSVTKLLKKGLHPDLPPSYDVKNIDVSKSVFLMIMNDNNYTKEKDNDQTTFYFSRQYDGSRIEISFIVNYLDKTVYFLDHMIFCNKAFTTFHSNSALDAFKKRVDFERTTGLKLLTISEKIKAVPENWTDDDVFMSYFEKNYLNNL